MVPGSTLRYGSNFWRTTRSPRASSNVPSDAAARPLPNELTTPPVTKMYFIETLLVSREPVFAAALCDGNRKCLDAANTLSRRRDCEGRGSRSVKNKARCHQDRRSLSLDAA